MSDVPKVWMVHCYRGAWFGLLAEGERWKGWAAAVYLRHEVDDELAKSGQRITIPDDVQPGWHAAPEDIPTPPPLPPVWVIAWSDGHWSATLNPPGPELRRAWADSGATAVYHLWMEDGEIRHAVKQP